MPVGVCAFAQLSKDLAFLSWLSKHTSENTAQFFCTNGIRCASNFDVILDTLSDPATTPPKKENFDGKQIMLVRTMVHDDVEVVENTFAE